MMKHKSLIVACLMVFWLVLGMSSSASAQYTFSLEATSDSAGNTPKEGFTPGEVLYLHIVLNDAGGVVGCAFTLEYPSGVLIPPDTDAVGLSAGITSAFPFAYQLDQTHRGNSSEPGRIFLAAAAIDSFDGGSLYSSGSVVLFSIRFTVSYDAFPGSFDIILKQTELWNLAAGYGVDHNGNGMYDEGIDETGKVAVLVGAVDNADPDWDNLAVAFPLLLPEPPSILAHAELFVKDGIYYNELIADFAGIGLWWYAEGAWSRINTVSPEGLVAVGNVLYVDYGGTGTGGYGLYKYDGAWTRIATNDASRMIAVGDVLYVDFVGIGLWKYARGAWSRINTVSPQGMVAVGNDLYVDYGGSGTGGYGLYKYDGAWTRLTTSDAQQMMAVGDVLYVDFAGIGLWRYAGGAWSRINKVSPEGMVAAGNELYVDYGGRETGGYGLYKYDGAWTRIATNDARLMCAVGDVLYVDFVGIGLWKYEGGAWSRINKVSPEGLVAVGNDLYVDYGGAGTGGYGLYKYDGAWIRLTTSDAQQMVAVNLQ